MTLKAVVADDHTIFRDGLVAILQAEGFEVVGDCASPDEAITLAETLHPDLLLLDVHMAGMQITEAVRQVRARAPQVRIVMLSAHTDQVLIEELFSLGVSGYLGKSIGRAELGAGLRAAMTDGATITMVPKQRANRLSLTDRERQVVLLLQQGLNNRQIAEQLFVSPATAKRTVSALYAKLGVSSRPAALRALDRRSR